MGVNFTGFITKILLYVDDVILIARKLQNLQKHLSSLSIGVFLYRGQMDVNEIKTRVVLLSLKQKPNHIQKNFIHEHIEITQNYKF